MAEQSRGSANTAQGIQAAGSLLSLYNDNKVSKSREADSKKQASLLFQTGDEIRRRFALNKIEMQKQSKQDVETVTAGFGATGGHVNNEVLMGMMTEAYQAIDVARQEAEYNAYIQDEEARAYERQAANESKARKKHTMGTILGTAGAVAGTVYGGPAGGAAGSAGGYALGSAIG